mgnify:CR=1 FL=1
MSMKDHRLNWARLFTQYFNNGKGLCRSCCASREGEDSFDDSNDDDDDVKKQHNPATDMILI